jgi:hypothetical protein
MDFEVFKKSLLELNDAQVLEVLDIVSSEVKRRNQMGGPDFASLRANTVEQNMKIVMDALSGLGIKIK